ncbi:MAG: hypothetical protein JO025_08345 [Verrucomicrobia bacterium]|nr:hypothetical protein [Verrucomicrobiota bacterium]
MKVALKLLEVSVQPVEQKPQPALTITKEQYEFFKSVYDEHKERAKTLEGRAQLYFTIQSLYFGFVILKFSDLFGSGKPSVSMPPSYQWFQVTVATFLAVALLFTLLAVRMRDYQTTCDPIEAAEALDGITSNERFFALRIGDFAVAANRNRQQNLRAAKCLRAACWLMVAAVSTHLLFFLCITALPNGFAVTSLVGPSWLPTVVLLLFLSMWPLLAWTESKKKN